MSGACHETHPLRHVAVHGFAFHGAVVVIWPVAPSFHSGGVEVQVPTKRPAVRNFLLQVRVVVVREDFLCEFDVNRPLRFLH